MAKGKKKMTTHKGVRNPARPNGKAWKQYPKGFDSRIGRLVTVPPSEAGTTAQFT